ncbi:MAG TPA: SURF1 family protein [Gemmatimonadales bacterium]|nr:SURF1 family protein [Gemmatimonadales bacterium]
MRAYGVLIGGVLAAAVCVRLGFWQVSRLHQRQAVRAMVEARQRQPELEVTALTAFRAVTLGIEDSLAYRPAVARGVFDFSRQVVVVARSVDEVPAVYVVTPLQLAGGSAILVERGWVPSPDAYTVPLDSLGEPDSAQVAGILLRITASREFPLPDSTWPVPVPVADPDRLAGRFPYRLLPWVLRRSQPGGPAAPAPPALRPIPLPVIDNGPHLSYAIQWFAFATIALVGSAALFRREKRTGRAGG